MVLVDDGTAQFRPTIVDDAVPNAVREEFIHYAEASADTDFEGAAPAELQFRIDAFEGVRKAVQEDAFEIFVEDGHLVVRGGGPRGVLYGMYELLERAFGIRWLAPGSDGTHIPDSPSSTTLVNDGIHAPDFAARVVGAFYSESYLLWAIRNRLQPTYWPADSSFPDPKPAVEARGGYLASTNIHSFYDLLPPSEYRENHPEWYSENQLDLRRDDVRDALVERCRQFFDANPEVKQVAVTPEDGYGWPADFASESQLRAQEKADQPTRVKHNQNVSEPFFHAISSIANRLKKSHPEKRLYTSAYVNYVWPPVTLKDIPENVTVAVAHYNPADYAHPIGSDTTTASKRFERILERWATKTDVPWFYGYTVKYAMDCLPFPIAYRLASDIQTLSELGFDGFYSQGGEGRWGQYGPHFYVMARMLWDASQSPDDILDSYFRGMFGRGATQARAGYEQLQTALKSADSAVDRHPLTEIRPMFSDELLDEVTASFDAAVQATTTTRTRRNARAIRLGVRYAPLYFHFREAISDYNSNRSRDALEEVASTYNSLAELVEHGAAFGLDSLPPSMVDPDGYFSLHRHVSEIKGEIDTSGSRWSVPE